MKNVLITGSNSFTGKHLSDYLTKLGYTVYGTTRTLTDPTLFYCDITDKSTVREVLKKVKPDYLIHLSAISFAAHDKHEDFYTVNTIGTINLLEALIELQIRPKKIILASSATVYGNQNKAILDESLCPKPSNHYGASKYAMESLVSNYFNKLPIIITRPFNYTGIGQAENFLIPKIVKHFQEKQRVIELGNLNVSREFNDIEFICKIYHALLNSSISGESINLCSGRGIQLLDVIDMMNELANYTINVKVNPAFVRRDEIKSLTGSPKKLFAMLGQIDQKPFKETLKGMLESQTKNSD